ncbi:hypothetical protein KGY64_07020 [Candidatus Bipolaricaulota bacterium]|nr:hypothetical protein [Candidatus Bipolaricaulota bacterium]
MLKRVIAISLVFLFGVSVLGLSQGSYEEFYRDYITSMASQIEADASKLDGVLDSWQNKEIAQSDVVRKLEEMEKKADSYFAGVLRLSPPEGEFQRHKQTVYVFVTWSTIIGMFTEGMADIDIAKLDAAVALSNYFERQVNEFDGEMLDTELD